MAKTYAEEVKHSETTVQPSKGKPQLKYGKPKTPWAPVIKVNGGSTENFASATRKAWLHVGRGVVLPQIDECVYGKEDKDKTDLQHTPTKQRTIKTVCSLCESKYTLKRVKRSPVNNFQQKKPPQKMLHEDNAQNPLFINLATKCYPI
ncbi:hypothetical protein HHI36_001372 [Cryptolaemus montrouzieri]|uniref:Uncharacterized protein n=1 Tax=Cryptolaemus montrouzieri TaxID=559131 RepID=A0ABD2P7S2_9CUCU